MPRELASDLDKLADIRHTLRPILLRHDDDIEIRLADHVLQNLGGGCGVPFVHPMVQDSIEQSQLHFMRGIVVVKRP